MQLKLRELESENNNLKKNDQNVSNNFTNNIIVNSKDENIQSNFIIDIEKKIREKSAEVKNLSIKNAELQSHIKKLEQDIILVNANISTEFNVEEVVEVRELRKKCSDLESNLRRKTRECDRFQEKLNNEQLLQDNITALKSSLKAAQVNADNLQQLEAICQKLSTEKREWVEMFQHIQ